MPSSSSSSSSPQNLKQWLKKTGTSQAELARKAGCKQSMISMILRRQRTCRAKLGNKILELTDLPHQAVFFTVAAALRKRPPRKGSPDNN